VAPRTEEQYQVIREKSTTKIVFAAMELFSERGYQGTSMADIAKKAGVSKGLIYNYFEGKEGILLSILGEALDEGEKIMQIEEKVPSKEHLKNIIERFFQSSKENMSFYKMILPIAFQVHKFPFVQTLMIEKRDKFLEDGSKIFTDLGFEDGDMEAWHLGALFDGIMLHMIHDEKDYPEKEMKQYLLKKYKLE
jgi:AcrR family transcriptional regulator